MKQEEARASSYGGISIGNIHREAISILIIFFTGIRIIDRIVNRCSIEKKPDIGTLVQAQLYAVSQFGRMIILEQYLMVTEQRMRVQIRHHTMKDLLHFFIKHHAPYRTTLHTRGNRIVGHKE